MKVGNIVVVNSTKGGFLSWAIRWITGCPYTHCAIGAGDVVGIPSIYEAQILISIGPETHITEDLTSEYEEYEVIGMSQDQLLPLVSYLYDLYAEHQYGFLQLPWYIYRRAGELLGYDMRAKVNPFNKKEVVCSVLDFYLILGISSQFPELAKTCEPYSPHSVHPGDVALIVHKHPEIFKLKRSRKL